MGGAFAKGAVQKPIVWIFAKLLVLLLNGAILFTAGEQGSTVTNKKVSFQVRVKRRHHKSFYTHTLQAPTLETCRCQNSCLLFAI